MNRHKMYQNNNMQYIIRKANHAKNRMKKNKKKKYSQYASNAFYSAMQDLQQRWLALYSSIKHDLYIQTFGDVDFSPPAFADFIICILSNN